MTPKEQLEISTPLYSCEKDEFKLQKKLGANTQIPTFQMLFPAEQSLVSVQTPEAQNTKITCSFHLLQPLKYAEREA